jgi:hypothetical protein
MPLPSVLNGAKQCQVLTKRTRLRCKNPCAFGSERACRLHGSHKSKNVLRGKLHPKYKNGEETLTSKAKRSEANLRLRRLEELGWHIQLFHPNAKKMVGRKPKGHQKLDLTRPEDLREAIIQSMYPLKNTS